VGAFLSLRENVEQARRDGDEGAGGSDTMDED